MRVKIIDKNIKKFSLRRRFHGYSNQIIKRKHNDTPSQNFIYLIDSDY